MIESMFFKTPKTKLSYFLLFFSSFFSIQREKMITSFGPAQMNFCFSVMIQSAGGMSFFSYCTDY